MNRNDEHLIFTGLQLFGGYPVCPNENGFVEVLSGSAMALCLVDHPRWAEIRQQPPLLVYDCPVFVSQNELLDYFCCFAADRHERDHLCLAFDGKEKRGRDHRGYRLVIYSAEDPTKAIGCTSFDLLLSEDIEQKEIDADVNLITLKCDFLYAYVLPEYRHMGVGAMLGVSMGKLFWQQIHHIWQQINDSETALIPLIYAQQFKRGGKDILKTVFREIKQFADANPSSGRISHLRMPQIVTG